MSFTLTTDAGMMLGSAESSVCRDQPIRIFPDYLPGKEKKRIDEMVVQQVSQSPISLPNAIPQGGITPQLLRAAYEQATREDPPAGAAEREQYFMTHIGMGEQLLARGLPPQLARWSICLHICPRSLIPSHGSHFILHGSQSLPERGRAPFHIPENNSSGRL